MRLLTGSGTPRRWSAANLILWRVCMILDNTHLVVLLAILTEEEPLPVIVACSPPFEINSKVPLALTAASQWPAK
jgi:hypothetical protein